jgi:hypothetical protein
MNGFNFLNLAHDCSSHWGFDFFIVLNFVFEPCNCLNGRVNFIGSCSYVFYQTSFDDISQKIDRMSNVDWFLFTWARAYSRCPQFIRGRVNAKVYKSLFNDVLWKIIRYITNFVQETCFLYFLCHLDTRRYLIDIHFQLWFL